MNLARVVLLEDSLRGVARRRRVLLEEPLVLALEEDMRLQPMSVY
jgi:hypothetical protein